MSEMTIFHIGCFFWPQGRETRKPLFSFLFVSRERPSSLNRFLFWGSAEGRENIFSNYPKNLLRLFFALEVI